MDIVVAPFLQGVQMFAVLALAPLLLGYTRKVKARALRRAGPPVLQPYRDLLKLIRKEAVLAHNASWLFRTAPYMIFAATWVAAALVPTFATGLSFSWVGDLIAIIALLGSARFFLALAGMDIGTSFGGIGSSREMLFASLAEGGWLITASSDPPLPDVAAFETVSTEEGVFYRRAGNVERGARSVEREVPSVGASERVVRQHFQASRR